MELQPIDHDQQLPPTPPRDLLADSGAPDFDMSPEAIDRRLRTVGQLNRLCRLLSQVKIGESKNQGKEIARVDDSTAGD